VKESQNKYLLDWLVTIVVALQEMRLVAACGTNQAQCVYSTATK